MALSLALGGVVNSHADESVKLVSNPSLSPDGSTLVFSWRGDLWTSSIEGGPVTQLTRHPSTDSQPSFSPDGQEIAFISSRTGSRQVYVMPAKGGEPEALTFHTAGFGLLGWYPDGQSLLVSSRQDHHWRRAERFFQIPRTGRVAPKLLFDAYGSDGSLSPDGNHLLFVREGTRWWRKGYRGAQSAQIWHANLESGEFQPIFKSDMEYRWPLFHPNGTHLYYCDNESSNFNLKRSKLDGSESETLTRFPDDSVITPTLSRDGSTMVFRHLADLFVYRPDQDQVPKPISLTYEGDGTWENESRSMLSSATDVAFTDDGLEIAFIAGGDLWVMDTELKEPKQVTSTPGEEREPVFGEDGKSIFFISDRDGQSDLWRAHRSDEDLYFWQNDEFVLTRLSNDPEVETQLSISPDGKTLAYVRGNGDLYISDLENKTPKRLLESWNAPDYDWSPDGKWMVYALSDNDFNSDVWVMPIDQSQAAQNISKHPDNESGPKWSPDGKIIAFAGRRFEDEVDVHYVFLREEDEDETGRDRRLEKALEKMNKARPSKDPKVKEPKEAEETAEKSEKPAENSEPAKDAKKEEKGSDLPEIRIDFKDIHKRVRTISIANSSESGLMFSPDSKKLAMVTRIDGRRGLYTVEIPDKMSPSFLSASTGSGARWLKKNNSIVWLSGGVPGSMSASGKATSYSFRVPHRVDLRQKHQEAFDLAWRSMRDSFYDEKVGNRNWDAVRRKYRPLAATPDPSVLSEVVSLMLGELNGSHLGFSMRGGGAPSRSDGWTASTMHLGVRFDSKHQGPGLRVRDVLPDGPADRSGSRIEAGEIVTRINQTPVDPSMDLSLVLNLEPGEQVEVQVNNADGESRTLSLRPISYGAVRGLLYTKWVQDTQDYVEEATSGTLGYTHIRGMNWPSFQTFERELYAVGAGREGIIIDVRENGGGFTTDHLLTVLCQPRHAITVPRGGGQGYPQDRIVYATWDKPIVVLCNQNSFSNAEIFSHAIKGLGRGQVVGVPTAGGVISTGGRSIMDMGFLRMPFRGWYVLWTGEDMELNGAVPHHIIWPQPGELPQGIDAQLDKAIEVLLEDIKKAKAEPQVKLRKSSDR